MRASRGIYTVPGNVVMLLLGVTGQVGGRLSMFGCRVPGMTGSSGLGAMNAAAIRLT